MTSWLDPQAEVDPLRIVRLRDGDMQGDVGGNGVADGVGAEAEEPGDLADRRQVLPRHELTEGDGGYGSRP